MHGPEFRERRKDPVVGQHGPCGIVSGYPHGWGVSCFSPFVFFGARAGLPAYPTVAQAAAAREQTVPTVACLVFGPALRARRHLRRHAVRVRAGLEKHKRLRLG